ncbi:MAG: hypothetical protein V2A76_07070 [Planctomycetota bacterium]
MIPLPAGELPRDRQQLAEFLRTGLSDLLEPSGDPPQVTLTGDPEQGYALLRIDLSGTTLKETDPLLRPGITAGEDSVLSVDQLEVSARTLRAFGASVQFHLVSHGVRFGRGTLPSGREVLIPTHLEEGSLRLSVSREELTRAARTKAQELLVRDGIALETLDLNLESKTDRSLGILVTARARKLLAATVRLRGLLTVDDRLDAVLSGLNGEADGFMGSLLAPVLSRLADRFEGYRVSLAPVLLGPIRLRDLRLAGNGGLEVVAELADH